MATITSDKWTNSDEWTTLIAESQHASFQAHLAEAAAEGTPVTSVIVVGGVPVVYNVIQE